MHVDHETAEPVYQQIAAIVRRRIEAGRETGTASDTSYPPGSAVPSIERIRQETGVAVLTVRKAMRMLADEGLVRIVPGKGTFVVGGGS